MILNFSSVGSTMRSAALLLLVYMHSLPNYDDESGAIPRYASLASIVAENNEVT